MKVHNGLSDFINIFASKKHFCALPLFGKIRNSFLHNLEYGRAARSVEIFMPSTAPLEGAFGRYEKIEQQETIKIFSSKIIRGRERRKMEMFFAKGQNSSPKKFISHQSPPERAYQTDLFGHSLHWIGIKRSCIDYLSISYVPFKNEIPRKVRRV